METKISNFSYPIITALMTAISGSEIGHSPLTLPGSVIPYKFYIAKGSLLKRKTLVFIYLMLLLKFTKFYLVRQINQL